MLQVEHHASLVPEPVMTKQWILIIAVLSATLGTDGFSNPSRKTWWTKRLKSDKFHAAGRLTERQIKYASEGGFKTVISLLDHDSDEGDPLSVGGNYLPSTRKSKDIAERLCGIKFEVVLEPSVSDWKTIDTLQRLYDIIRKNRKPILFFSNTSYAATYLMLLHFANITEKGDIQAGEPMLRSEEVFQVGAELGFNFDVNDKLVDLVRNVTGEKAPNCSASSISYVHSKEWYEYYWQMKPVYKKIFISGQIHEDDLPGIEASGMRNIVNNRRGMTNLATGRKSQEEVTLLNIKDRTGTYIGRGRQTVKELEASRIDPNKPNFYISQTSLSNYEKNNTGEFGDRIGYNEVMERNAVNRVVPNIGYFHLPIGGRYGYDTRMWKAYKDELADIFSKGAVLMKCRTGSRSGTLAVLWSAYIYCLNSTWAINRGREIGYNLAADESIIGLYKEVLDKRSGCVPYDKSSSARTLLPSLLLALSIIMCNITHHLGLPGSIPWLL